MYINQICRRFPVSNFKDMAHIMWKWYDKIKKLPLQRVPYYSQLILTGSSAVAEKTYQHYFQGMHSARHKLYLWWFLAWCSKWFRIYMSFNKHMSSATSSDLWRNRWCGISTKLVHPLARFLKWFILACSKRLLC